MNKASKIAVAACLIVLMAAGAFVLGYQHMEKIPLDEPFKMTRITLTVNGISAKACAELAQGEIVANRLVENLMLHCAPDDLRQSMNVRSEGSDTVIVEIAMEQEGTMAYFADELVWILQEEANASAENTQITVADQRNLTITYEEQPSLMTAGLCAALGGVLGVLISVLLFSVKMKSVKE